MKDRLSCSTTPRAASQQINSQQTWVIPYDDFDRGSPARAHHMGSRRGQEIRQTKEGKEKTRSCKPPSPCTSTHGTFSMNVQLVGVLLGLALLHREPAMPTAADRIRTDAKRQANRIRNQNQEGDRRGRLPFLIPTDSARRSSAVRAETQQRAGSRRRCNQWLHVDSVRKSIGSITLPWSRSGRSV
jgi:hypothetical protein